MMAIPSYQIDILGRGGGRSAQKQAAYGSGKTIRVQSMVRVASYRAGEELHDQQLEQTFDYSHREDVAHEEMLVPEIAPDYAHDREQYWNEVDQREKHVRAQFARSLTIALPRELTLEQNTALLHEHLETEFVSKGLVVDFAIHVSDASDKDAPPKGLPFDGKNPHAHVLVSMRGFEEKTRDDGTTEVIWKKNKAREMNGWDANKKKGKGDRDLPLHQRFTSADTIKAAWAQLHNEHLAKAGSSAEISMESYQARGIELEPTLHMGYQNMELEKQGIRTERGDHNRAVKARNAARTKEKMDGMVANDAPEQPQNAPQQEKKPEVAQPLQDKDNSSDDALKRQPDTTQAAGWQWMKDTASRWQQAWDRQADKVSQGYRRFAGVAMLEKIKHKWRTTAAQEIGANKEKEENYRQKPRHLWSLEQKEDYRKMHPYLEAQAELSRQERAQAVAVAMHHMEKQRQQERQAVMQRIQAQREKIRQAQFQTRVRERPPPERKR